MMRDPNSKYVELHETLPAEPIPDKNKKTITFHGALYAFPDYSDKQLKALVDQMESVNESGRYSAFNNLVDRLKPFRVGKARRRKPGRRVPRGRVEIVKK